MAKLTPAERTALAYETEKKYGLPKGMLVAQLNTESSNGQNNYNPTSGATGAMQFMPATAQARGIDPNDDTQAIDGAGSYMADNLKASKGNVAQALKLYYAGSPKGIGPKSEAYSGTVAAHWNPDDAFEAAMGGNTQPASGQPDYGKSFDTAMGGSAPESDAPQADEQPAEDPALVNLKAGMQHIAGLTKDPRKVREFVTASGYDPDSMANIDANAKTGVLHFASDFDQTTKPLIHTTGGDLSTGFQRGVHDVSGTGQSLIAYEDQQHPWLGAIDNGLSHLVGTPSVQGYQNLSDANILTRKAYDQSYGSVASGTGRFAGNALTAAAVAAPAATVLPAIIPEAAAPAAEFLAGRGGSSLLARGASLATAGSIAGGTGNALTASASDQPLDQRVESGMKVGAVLGPVVGAGGAAIGAVTNRVAPGVDAMTANLARVAKEKYGIDLDADQITNSPLVRKVSAMMNLNPVNNHLARDVTQRGQFTRAVGQTFGADADSLTPQVMSAAKDRIGGTMDAIAARNPVHVDDHMMGDLAEIENEAQQALPEGEFAPIGRQMDNVLSQASKNGGTLTGEQYQALTRKGSPLDVASNSANPNIRHYALQVRGALDDGLERSASPEDVALLRQARLQYKNLKTVEPLVSKSTENQITPALLNNRVSVNFKNRAYQGAGDLDELAHIGQRFLTPPSTSGTPEGIRAGRMLEGASTGTAIGLALGGHALGYGNAGDIAGLSLFAGKRAAGAVSNTLIRRVFQSQAYKNKLLGSALDADAPVAPQFPPMPLFYTNRLAGQLTSGQPAPKGR